MGTEVLSWDWKGQPDLDALGRAIERLSLGRVLLHKVDTGSDDYAIVLATEELSPEQARDVYDEAGED